jgi:nucleoside-diphosphate kinase
MKTNIRGLLSRMDNSMVRQFYKEHVDKFFFAELEEVMTSAPITVAVLEGPGAIGKWRELLGPTHASLARLQQPQSLRARFGISDTRNAFHGSGM